MRGILFFVQKTTLFFTSQQLPNANLPLQPLLVRVQIRHRAGWSVAVKSFSLGRWDGLVFNGFPWFFNRFSMVVAVALCALSRF